VLRDGRGVSIRLVLLFSAVAAGFSYVILRLWTDQGGALPPPSWGGLVVLVFMACGVVFAALPVRRFLRGHATKPLNPLRAMRTLVLAQASALTGALVTGWYVAQVLVLIPILDVPSRRAVAIRLAALAAGGVLMAVAGLLAQAMCRVDKDKDRRDPDRGRDRSLDRDGEQGPDGSHDH
jgi:hypothetical protein